MSNIGELCFGDIVVSRGKIVPERVVRMNESIVISFPKVISGEAMRKIGLAIAKMVQENGMYTSVEEIRNMI